ncbi:MAG TPA: VWA domain-containing protein [Candidatus Acidoferrales bacterium]
MIRTFSNFRSCRFFLAFPFAAANFLFCLSPVLHAQEANGIPQAGIQATTEIVKIDASVLDRQNKFVAGLSQNRFRVLDNGIEQPIVFFAPIEAAAQVLVMLETSPAVYLIHAEHLTAAYALLDGLAPDDQVALVSYSQSPQAILSFTSDKPALAAALGQVQYTLGMGNLNFYDSVSTVLDWIAPLHGKKAIVLLTTGLDSSPPERWDALVEKLKKDETVVYAIALGGSLRHPPSAKKKKSKAAPKANETGEPENPVTFAKADAALVSLAKITGGRAYFPESPNDFVTIYSEIASSLRHQYVLGIAPQHDGKFHSLSVQILGTNGPSGPEPIKSSEFHIFAREGYLAPLR